MPFRNIDAAAISRALSRIAERTDDVADAFFERLEVIGLPANTSAPGIEARREQGLAVRLARDRKSWLAACDSIGRESFIEALHRVARAQPPLMHPFPEIEIEPWDGPPAAGELLRFPSALDGALRKRDLGSRWSLELKRYRRWTRVVGTRLSSQCESEIFYSLRIELDGCRYGSLLADLGPSAESRADRIASILSADQAASLAKPPRAALRTCVLGPAATAVLLHEAVAHALESDTLIAEGPVDAALSTRFGSEVLDVFDDPSGAPSSVRRSTDDEGYPVFRRCLLRAGVVEQVLSDGAGSRASEQLSAGAGRRPDRHLAPVPRSTHLELVAGTASRNQLFTAAGDGLYLPRAERGHLDPASGVLELRFPGGRWIRDGGLEDPFGPCRLRGRATDILKRVAAVGAESREAGSGWCAKSGVRLPVWATVPPILLSEVDIR